MTTPSEVVKQSDLLNQLVLDRNTMEELGHVDVLWMHPPAHRVLGFICKSGFLGTKKTAFNLAQINTLGANSILVKSQPTETDAEKVRQLESLLNCEVWSDTGNKIGKITDYLFNSQTGTITQYLFVSSGWEGVSDIYQLPPKKIVSFGRKRVLVSEAAVKSLVIYREGVKQKLTKATEELKEDYLQATQELRSLGLRSVRSLTHQAQAATEQAKERARLLTEQARERAQRLNQQLQEETEILAKQAKEKSQTLAEQVKERSQTIGEQVRKSTDTLTEQVKEKLDPLSEIDIPPTSSPTSASPTSASPTLVDERTGNNLTGDEPAKAIDPGLLEDDDEPWI